MTHALTYGVFDIGEIKIKVNTMFSEKNNKKNKGLVAVLGQFVS